MILAAETSRSIKITGIPPLVPNRNGIIVNHTIFTMVDDSTTLEITTTASAAAITDGIRPVTIYTCSVAASTRVGHGPQTADLSCTRKNFKRLQLTQYTFPPSLHILLASWLSFTIQVACILYATYMSNMHFHSNGSLTVLWLGKRYSGVASWKYPAFNVLKHKKIEVASYPGFKIHRFLLNLANNAQ